MPEQQPPTPSKRTWIVPCYFRHAQTGELLRDAETGQLIPDHQEVAAAYIEVRAILRRQGGVMSIGTKREEVEPGRVETTELLFRHETFAPIVHEDEAASNGNGGVPDEEPAADEAPVTS